MNLTKQTRDESFAETRPHFNKQETEILIQLNLGKADAWSIASATGMLITSIRRGLTDLCSKNIICEKGNMFNWETGRNVTTYKIIDRSALTDPNQQTLF